MIRLLVCAVLVFLALPNLMIVASSFNDSGSFGLPLHGASLRWYTNLLQVPSFGAGVVNSLLLASAATLACGVLGTAAAFAIIRYRFAGRQLLNALIMGPLVVPEVVMGLSFLIAITGLRGLPPWLTVLVLHMVIVLPYVVRVMMGVLQRTDPNLEAAAQLLGASPLQSVLLITLPIVARGIVGVLVLAFVISFHNFTATFFLVSNQTTLPIAIFQYIRTESDPTVAALSTLLMLAAMVMVWLTSRFLGLEKIAK